ncbi:hypothetical protein [uncultured Cohaesibacter sp.]|uniref:hypothetical protein n=1 Tax=uncultured Cohaesibacter sp. TaxID=1002546 RepID=UPI0029C912FE|nr:hypothetical protein [uncultured Cohaesibacter sp.]
MPKFKLTETDSYWWPVKVRVPDPENAGKIIEQELEILFEPEDQDTALNAQEEYASLMTPRERIEHERDQLLRVCKNWRGLDGDLPFSEAAFRQALTKSWFRIGVYSAYGQSLNGEAARLGN